MGVFREGEIANCFSNTYREARGKFVDSAKDVSDICFSIKHPLNGIDGKPLYTDVAYSGGDSVEKLLIVCSGVHGVEGFCGSGCQIYWLKKFGKSINKMKDIGFLIIHAMNPYGFSWLKRVDEDNVDLNRNFIDFSKEFPTNPVYSELSKYIVPQKWESKVEADKVLEDYAQKHGHSFLYQSIMAGQYTNQNGIFYGGTQPSWPNKIFCRILNIIPSKVRDIVFADIHTGLGDWGNVVIAKSVLNENQSKTVSKIYNIPIENIESIQKKKVSKIRGDIYHGITSHFQDRNVIPLCLECGTLEINIVLDALRADAFLFQYGEKNLKNAKSIRRNIKNAFYQNTNSWKKSVCHQVTEYITKAPEYLKNM